MPAILFDARWLRPGMTGVGHYTLRLLETLTARRSDLGMLLPEDSPFRERFPHARLFTAPVDLIDHPRTEFYEQLALPRLCRRHGFGTLVSMEARVPLVHPGIRTACIIHDLAHLTVKGSHGPRYSAFLNFTIHVLARSADTIFTVSETVRAGLAKRLRRDPSRFAVASPSDSGLARHDPIPVPAAAEGPGFLLAVGMTNPRKNLTGLLDGFAAFRASRPGYRLVLTGNREGIEKELAGRDARDILNLGFVEEGRLRWLYGNAKLLVFPSLDEGFGIPMVDASVFGCPIACSDIPIFREVGGGDARFFDPRTPESIAAALRETLDRPLDSRPLASRYGWERTADAFLRGLGEA